MATNYPVSIDTVINLPTVIDNTTAVTGSSVNILRDTLIAIETELGVKPSGTYTNVRTRLDFLETTLDSITSGGGGSGVIISGTPIVGQTIIWSGSAWVPSTNFQAQSISTTGSLTSGPALSTSLSTGLANISGKTIINGINVSGVNPPAVSDVGQSIIYYDGYQQKLLASENGQAYTPVLITDYQNITIPGSITAGPILGTSLTGGLLTVDGKIIVNQINTTGLNPPALSDNGQAIIYFDGYQNSLLMSEDGSNYYPLLTSTSSYPVVFPSVNTPLLTLDGKFIVNGITSSLVSNTGQGIIYFDSVANKFFVSENGGSYTPLLISDTTAGGDLSGTYPNPTVAKIQGNSVQSGSLGPSQDGYVLTWHNASSQFQTLPVIIGADAISGDVTGNISASIVSSISGASPILITPSVLEFRQGTSTPTITQSDQTSDTPTFNLTLKSQTAYSGAVTNTNSGNVNIILSEPVGGGSHASFNIYEDSLANPITNPLVTVFANPSLDSGGNTGGAMVGINTQGNGALAALHVGTGDLTSVPIQLSSPDVLVSYDDSISSPFFRSIVLRNDIAPFDSFWSIDNNSLNSKYAVSFGINTTQTGSVLKFKAGNNTDSLWLTDGYIAPQLNNMSWIKTTTPTITQDTQTSGNHNGATFTIKAQSGTGITATGGQLTLQSGAGTSGGIEGNILLNIPHASDQTNGGVAFDNTGTGNYATSGIIRLPNNQGIYARNSTNSGDFLIAKVDNSNELVIGNYTDATTMTIGSAGLIYMQSNSSNTGYFSSNGFTMLVGSYLFSNSNSTPSLQQSQQTSDTTTFSLTVRAQSAYSSAVANVNGGALLLSGGEAKTSGTTGLRGSVRLQLGWTGSTTLVEVVEPVVGQRVVALCQNGSGISFTQMPTNTGDGVVYLANATTAPTANPTSGGILYSTSSAATWRDAAGTTKNITPVSSGSVNSQAQQQLEYTTYGSIATSGNSITLNVPLATSGTSCALTITAIIRVQAAGTGTSLGDTFSERLFATFKNVGGTVSQVGSGIDLTPLQSDSSLSSSAITTTISGTNIVCTLTATVSSGTLGTVDTTMTVQQLVN